MVYNKIMNDEQLTNLRHSAAHLLAKAVKELWPGAHNAIGPAIENGFYQDFDMGDHKISEEDFPKIEAKMREILPTWQKFSFNEVTLAEAKKLFKDNKYKVEMATEFAKEGKKLMTNDPGDFLDLCKMGHVENPSKELIHFKLLSVAGAYWRGSEKNKMLTRIYGTCWPSQKELDSYLHQLEEAKKRDHRKLGKDLGLFVFSDLVGAGLPLLTPKGATIRRILERFIVDEELKRGYSHVYTPPLAKVDLYRTSGHYPYYKETMYPSMKIDEDELILRPMTCPHHFMLYKSEPRSYRDLPIRYAEISPQFRYEKSGELTGLMRVRTFMLSDAHIITQPENAKSEIRKVLDLIDYVNKSLGLTRGRDYRYRLSLGDRNEEIKYQKDDAAWDKAEAILRQVLDEVKAPYFEAPNEAAFYGPKIDVQIKNVNGKEDTAFTVQYDFVMPKRFKLTYIDQSGKEVQPVVVHRASLGAFERTIAFLIEKYAGAFPLWLAPVQVEVIPIAERHNKAALEAVERLKTVDIRAEADTRNEPMQAKVRNHALQKVPYLAIIGDQELKNQTLAIRTRGGKDLKGLTFEDFLAKLKEEIEAKLPT
ncbi:threonine--tRNA ligase [Candidatus Gottesmanbacteria bacterium RIFCSPLOWO2_01_FULL_43_11b]|uniref:Threonine--tRNA ligase n=1 Tax=Candidatus Gottesmanbacteria bacterium RIFCSPLOWO2_01_FULL_43_11b TaxID=1798392 RepID=A0A1F6AG60_9BACT|nr:MAG: threonine--tRNA ligase [Candidatus Gottesmanbacteria bacterium RIFCSPLOWO2_01_FULL_43_11b]